MGIKHILNPVLFQGYRKKNRYFEGWYYKLVSKDEQVKIAFIPGISMAGVNSHTFVQVFLSKKKPTPTLKTFYFRHDSNAFSFENTPFSVKIGDNIFSETTVSVSLNDAHLSVSGQIQIGDLIPLEKSLWQPNVMGPFGYLNFMECYHGVITLNSPLKGSLWIDGEAVSFESGKAYIEKDWGKSFPRAYVWVQTNHFKDSKTSLMFSYADIPFLGFYFKGLICTLYFNQKEYRFATYNFTKVKAEELSPKRAFYKLNKGRYTLEIEALQEDQIELPSPVNGAMIQSIKEGLSGKVNIKLYDKKTLIYEDTGLEAGIEIMKK